MKPNYNFIEVHMNGYLLNINTGFISDVIQIDNIVQVLIHGEWYNTTLKNIKDIYS